MLEKELKKSERRTETRYPVEVDIVIFSGKNFFRTKTLDISSNGCQLRDPIPESFSADSLEVVLTGSEDGRQSFQMVRGTMVDGSRRRLMLKTNFQCVPA